MIDIIGVDTAVLGVEDLEAAQRFFRDLGLAEVESGAAGSTFHTQDGTGIVVRNVADHSLPKPVATGSNIRETIWGVSSKADLEQIGAELAKDRQVQMGANSVLRTIDDDNLAIAFQVTKRHAFNAEPLLSNVAGLPPQRPANRQIDFAKPVFPRTIGHVVYTSPNPEAAIRFYIDRLQFRLTDKFIGGEGSFARAPGSKDHHTIFIIHEPTGRVGLHHISFHVTDFNEVMLAGQRLTNNGWKTALGPGRHYVGSNYFWYFQSPCGGAMELDADIDYATDDWKPGEWEFRADQVAAWSASYAEPGDPTKIAAHE